MAKLMREDKKVIYSIIISTVPKHHYKSCLVGLISLSDILDNIFLFHFALLLNLVVKQ